MERTSNTTVTRYILHYCDSLKLSQKIMLFTCIQTIKSAINYNHQACVQMTFNDTNSLIQRINKSRETSCELAGETILKFDRTNKELMVTNLADLLIS